MIYNIILNLNSEIIKYLNKNDIILYLNTIIRLNKNYLDIRLLYNNKYIKWNISNNILYFPELRFVYDKYCFIIIKHYLIPSYCNNNNNKLYFIDFFEKEVISSNHVNVINKFSEILNLYLGTKLDPYNDYYHSYILKIYSFDYIYDFINKYNNFIKDSIFIQCYLYENNILYDILIRKDKYIKYPTSKSFINLKSTDTNYNKFNSLLT